MRMTNEANEKAMPPKMFRRDVRMRKAKRRGFEMNSRGKKKNDSMFNTIGFTMWNPQAIFTPKRKKFKGWQKALRH